MATEAVFETCELLENILVHLPATDIPRHAKKVCKAWRALIKNSPRIRRACVIVPDAKFMTIGGCKDSVPVYPDCMRLKLNPAFEAAEYYVSGTKRIGLIVILRYCYEATYRTIENEYITSPPCKTIFLYDSYLQADGCSVYNTRGITVKDVLDCLNRLDVGEERNGYDFYSAATIRLVGCQYDRRQDALFRLYGPKMKMLRERCRAIDAERGLWEDADMDAQVPPLRYAGTSRTRR